MTDTRANLRRSPDVVVIGAGVVGLSCAWRAAGQGLNVMVVDPRPGRGASWAAAGMLAPVTEANYGEASLLRLNLASATAWPAFAAEVEEAAGQGIGYLTCGTLVVALDSGDLAWLEALHRFQRSMALPVELLGRAEARSLEPSLSPGIQGGLLAKGDHQVDNRKLVQALLIACQRSGVTTELSEVRAVSLDRGRVTGVVLTSDTRISAGKVLLSAGSWSGRLGGLPPDVVPPVRPVKGVVLRLRGPRVLSRSLRGLVNGGDTYLVPRADGSLVLGATVEEAGFDTSVTAGAVADLIRDARLMVPTVEDLVLVETLAGLRPGSPDNGPILGPSTLEGLVLATGHYRNGVLLAPVTADSIARVLAGGAPPAAISDFSPWRSTLRPVSSPNQTEGQPAFGPPPASGALQAVGPPPANSAAATSWTT